MRQWMPKTVEVYNRHSGRADDDQPGIDTIQSPGALSGGVPSACLTCGKDPGIFLCGKCKLARSTHLAPSADCQKQDWAGHKTISGIIETISRTFDEPKEGGKDNTYIAATEQSSSRRGQIFANNLAPAWFLNLNPRYYYLPVDSLCSWQMSCDLRSSLP
ncbi:hypothetical protein C8R45DRAFT_944180 [Mycena sanguinolenta]|nr:hypothetical protein C8R45DRAFT_944180 [Mycena sanguinolenta]